MTVSSLGKAPIQAHPYPGVQGFVSFPGHLPALFQLRDERHCRIRRR